MSTTLTQDPQTAQVWVAHCKQCNRLVVFPHTVPNDGHGDTHRLAPGLSLIYVCSACNHKSVFSAQEIQLQTMENGMQKAVSDTLWRVVIACEEKDCGRLMEVFTCVERFRRADEVLWSIMRAKPPIYCSRGHALYEPPQVRSMEAMRSV